MSNGMSLNGTTGTCRDATHFHNGRLTSEFGNLVLVVCKVGGHFPLPVFCYNRTYGEGCLDTAVLQ